MERSLPTSKALKDSTTEDLEGIYDSAVDWVNTQTNVGDSVNSVLSKATFVREELHRRVAERSERVMRRLTWAITFLTAVNVAAVAVALVVA